MRRLTALAALAFATAACSSGTSSYSSTFNVADVKYAKDALLHLKTTESAVAAMPFGPDSGSQKRVVQFRQITDGEIASLTGALESTGVAIPTQAAATEHSVEHPDPGLKEATTKDEVMLAINRATTGRARDYLPTGRQPALLATAQRTIDERDALSSQLEKAIR